MLRQKVKSSYRYQQGISLIELMVGVTVALILLSGVISVFVNMSVSSGTAMKMSQMNTEIRSVVNLMTRELQKAGYVNAWDDVNEKIRVDELAAFGLIGPTSGCDINTANCNCILYRYDQFDDFTLSNEFYGFRLNNGAIQIKTGGAAGDDSCDDGNWEGITSADLTITELTFGVDAADSQVYEIEDDNDNGACDSGEICLDRRKVNIALTSVLTSDNSVSLSLDTEIKLMNDRYYTSP